VWVNCPVCPADRHQAKPCRRLIPFVAEAVAKALGVPVAEVYDRTRANARGQAIAVFVFGSDSFSSEKDKIDKIGGSTDKMSGSPGTTVFHRQ